MELIEVTNPVLRQVADVFDFTNPVTDPIELSAQMKKIMVDAGGIGLAAPQIGLSTRMFIMGDEFDQVAVFNPTVIETSEDTIFMGEGCLSYPGLYLKIRRPNWIQVRFQNQLGQEQELKFTDIWARCFLHESEHLDGICHVDKVGPLALKMAMDKLKKSLKGKK